MALFWLLERERDLDQLPLWPDLLSFMGAIEIAVLRALCKTTNNFVAGAPEHAFDFTFSPIIPLLPKFDSYQQLEWVIHRLGEDYSLVQRRPCPKRHLRALYTRWRRVGMDPSGFQNSYVMRRCLLLRLIRAFWNHAHVQALLALAIRFDSSSLLRRVAAEAPGEYLSDDDDDGPNNGVANFMYNVWVKIEEDHFQEHGPWEPLGRDDVIAFDSDLFFGRLHFVLWKYMAAVRKRQQRDFNGYCRHCDFIVPGVICDPRCPRE
jgi:hypothetical protein